MPMTRKEHMLNVFKEAETGLGDVILDRLATVAAAACQDSLDGYPKGGAIPDLDTMVQITCTEANARVFERESLRPRRCHLAGPLLFDEDDIPTYIIGVEA